MDKLQIIERYNHRTKRCCVLSQDDGTSSSDRRAIECPKAGNVRKTRQRAHRSPSDCWYCSGVDPAGTAASGLLLRAFYTVRSLRRRPLAGSAPP